MNYVRLPQLTTFIDNNRLTHENFWIAILWMVLFMAILSWDQEKIILLNLVLFLYIVRVNSVILITGVFKERQENLVSSLTKELETTHKVLKGGLLQIHYISEKARTLTAGLITGNLIFGNLIFLDRHHRAQGLSNTLIIPDIINFTEVNLLFESLDHINGATEVGKGVTVAHRLCAIEK